MANTINFLENTKDTTITDPSQLTELDQLVFAQLAYIRFEALTPEQLQWKNGEPPKLTELAQYALDNMNSGAWESSANEREFLRKITQSTRYAQLTISDVDGNEGGDEKNAQWAAITIHIPGEPPECAVAYRGTNGTTYGWYEDFQMAYSDETNAQREAARYLKEVMAKYGDADFTISGHSKGGNNAIYAYIALDDKAMRDRIRQIYDYDGPGVREDIAAKYAGAYRELDNKLQVYCPQDSIIGMLLKDHSSINYIYSDAGGNIGEEHDPYNFQLSEDGTSLQPAEQSDVSKFLNHMIDDALSSLSYEDRYILIEVLYEIGAFDIIAKQVKLSPEEGEEFLPIEDGDLPLVKIVKYVINTKQVLGSDAEITDKTKSVVDSATFILKTYQGLDDDQKRALANTFSTILFCAGYNMGDLDKLIEQLNQEIAQKVDEIHNSCNEKVHEISSTLKKVMVLDPVAVALISVLEELTDAVLDGLDYVAKNALNWLIQAYKNRGSKRSYSRDKIKVNFNTIADAVSALNRAQNIAKELDTKLDELRSALRVAEFYDKAVVAEVDFGMTGENVWDVALEHLFLRGYDRDIERSINYLNAVKEKLQTNEDSLVVMLQ